MSKWLYQYWLFSFSTCKYWGQGPRHWTAHDLLFEEYDTTEFRSSANTPATIEHQVGLDGGESEDTQPSRFCHYAIHVVHHDVDDFIESHGDGADLDEGWPAAWTEPPIEERLRDGLENNDFSNVAKETLPLCIPSIVQATVKSPGELVEESFSFAIMARNQELVATTMRRARDANIDLSSTYPLHIATSYLDGGKSCCNILDQILNLFCRPLGSPQALNRNEHQHTVLDNLILTILKGHSKTPLEMVDESLRREARFAGCEVDLCGRWDADSHCYRVLLQKGKTDIPLQWKHKFCHTSTQAVSHCILSLAAHGIPLAAPSGLFVRWCMNENCGMKLELGPLHALTLATFHLGEDGCEEEDLFGMIAVLLCLLRCFVPATEKAHISMDAILKRGDGGTCSHEDLTPFELSQKLPQEAARLWGTHQQQGWRIFCHILRIAQETTFYLPDEEDEPDMDDYLDVPFEADADYEICFEACEEGYCFQPDALEPDLRCFGRSSKLGHVWAAVQAELLTYRRQSEAEPWISPRFDLARLLQCLDTDSPISMPMIDEGLMKGYCRCGVFNQADWGFALREMAANGWFGNLDIWDRSTFIDVPPRLEAILY